MNEVTTKADVQRLEDLILQGQQVDLMTTHAMQGGMYARTVYLKAGTVLTGATHKTDHLNVVVGDISVTTDEGMTRLTGHHVIETKAGMKRAGYAHSDTVWTTICKTDKTDLQDIENELVVESDKLQTRHPELMANIPKHLEG
jgi:hypothetical protein